MILIMFLLLLSVTNKNSQSISEVNKAVLKC